MTFADWQKLPGRKPAASSPGSDEIWIFEELLIGRLFKNALLMKAELGGTFETFYPTIWA